MRRVGWCILVLVAGVAAAAGTGREAAVVALHGPVDTGCHS